jgi:hypothetical protein
LPTPPANKSFAVNKMRAQRYLDTVKINGSNRRRWVVVLNSTIPQNAPLSRAHATTAQEGSEWPLCPALASPIVFPAKLRHTPLGNQMEGVERGL